MFLCATLRIEDKVQTSHSEAAEKRLEEPIRDVIWLFAPALMYFGLCASIEAVYQAYVYSIALCSDLAFSVSTMVLTKLIDSEGTRNVSF